MDYIIVGLGNPGKEYEKTRHNAGWLSIDRIAEKYGVKVNKLKFKSSYATVDMCGKKVLLLKPQTFMNLSGIAIKEAADFYKVKPENIIVICDDISLPCAKLRIRRNGSAGGHRGLISTINMLETENFPRIKIGISDRADKNSNLADWVVGNFSSAEFKEISSKFDDVCTICEMMVSGQTDKAMAKFN